MTSALAEPVHCGRCGRQLTAPLSRRRRIGPCCWRGNHGAHARAQLPGTRGVVVSAAEYLPARVNVTAGQRRH